MGRRFESVSCPIAHPTQLFCRPSRPRSRSVQVFLVLARGGTKKTQPLTVSSHHPVLATGSLTSIRGALPPKSLGSSKRDRSFDIVNGNNCDVTGPNQMRETRQKGGEMTDSSRGSCSRDVAAWQSGWTQNSLPSASTTSKHRVGLLGRTRKCSQQSGLSRPSESRSLAAPESWREACPSTLVRAQTVRACRPYRSV